MDGEPVIYLEDLTFRALAMAYWDTDGDGFITEEEASAPKTLTTSSINDKYGSKIDIADYRKLTYNSWACIPFLGSAKVVYFGKCSGTKMSNSMIRDNTYLEYVDLEWSNLTSIDHTNFANCTNLKEFIAGDTLEDIAHYVFRDCTSLTTVRLGTGTKSLQQQTLAGCIALKELYIKATIPPTIGSIGGGTFLKDSPNCNLYVPRASVDAYKTATNWSVLASRIVEYDF